MGTEVIPVKEEQLEEPSELEQKIIRQIEYYFGNYNLRRDKFLKGAIQSDDGWVPLETMVKFNRLKQLSSDYEVISAALKKSVNQLVEVNEDCTKIRRKTPIPEQVGKDELEERTLYVKGFKKDTKLDEILEFFKGHKVENVFMRKKKQVNNKWFFKGSVFATFESKEDSEAYLEKKGLKFDKLEMIKERKKDYVKRKDIFYDNLREEKAKKDAERAKKGPGSDFTKGCLLRIKGLGGNVSRAEVKEAMEKLGKVAFVDYFSGNADAVIRFDEAIVADIIKDLPEEDGEKKMDICDVKASVALIEGEEEDKYWQVIIKSKANSRQRGGNNKFGNKGRFNKKPRNKRFKGGRNKNDSDEERDDDDRPPSKKVKRESTENGAAPEKSGADNAGAENNEPPSKKVKTENTDSANEPAVVSAD